MNIGIDLDNTVGKYLQIFCRRANELYGKNLSIQDMISPDVRFESIGLLSQEQVISLKKLDQEQETFLNMPMYEDAKKVLQSLCQEADVFFITSRDNYELKLMHRHTQEWLSRNEIVQYRKILFQKQKGTTAKKLRLNCFVEDNLQEALSIAPFVDRVFLLERPWNKLEITSEKINKVKDWYAIKNIIGKH